MRRILSRIAPGASTSCVRQGPQQKRQQVGRWQDLIAMANLLQAAVASSQVWMATPAET